MKRQISINYDMEEEFGQWMLGPDEELMSQAQPWAVANPSFWWR